jgi:hypothetical protein
MTAHPTYTPVLLFYPKRGPGDYCNKKIGVQIVSENITTPTGLTAVAGSSGTLAAGTYGYKVSALSAAGETLATAEVTATTTGVTGSVALQWTHVLGATGYNVYGRTAAGEKYMTVVGLSGLSSGNISWTDTGSITPNAAVSPPVAGPTASPYFKVHVYDLSVSTTNPVVTYNCTLDDNVDNDGVQTRIEQRINPFDNYISVTSNVSLLVSVPTIVGTSSIISLDGGKNGSTVTVNQLTLAWDNFKESEIVDVDLLIHGGVGDVSLMQKIDSVATYRGTASGLLDVPSLKQGSAQAMIDFRNLELNINSSFSAMFGPDLLENDPYNGKSLYVPMSGYAAALCARTDRIQDPWYSIAGLNRGMLSVLGVRKKFSDAERTNLFNAQINYPRQFSGIGIALWEQVTLLAKKSALSWYNVRRLVNIVKKSVYIYLLYSLQEPNDDFLRKQIVDALSQYLEIIKNRRGIQDYLIVSSLINNPPIIYNAGILKVSVFITPTIATHEIQVDMIVTKQGVVFSEINLANL